MLRRGVACLHKSTLSEVIRLWLGGQPQYTLYHTSNAWSSNKSSGSSESSSSSSDSDSDADLGKGVDEKLKKAAENVAQAIPGHGSVVQSDLLKQLQSFSKVSKDQAAGAAPPASANKLSDLLTGMQVQKSIQRRNIESGDSEVKRPKSGQFSQQRTPFRRQQSQPDREKVKLFDGPSLGIFTSGDTAKASQKQEPTAAAVAPQPTVSLWEKVHQEQMEMFRRQPPTNAFEEMIQWTQEGKLWQFPINNEQGMEEEAKIGFHQHVFLEDQIQDFPRRGPIRHFMELVLVGLSKNPYLSVQQKHEHIDWFRQYFKEKQDVLQEALGQDGLIASAKTS